MSYLPSLGNIRRNQENKMEHTKEWNLKEKRCDFCKQKKLYGRMVLVGDKGKYHDESKDVFICSDCVEDC